MFLALFTAYIVIVAANHFTKRNLLTQTVGGFVRIYRFSGKVRSWYVTREQCTLKSISLHRAGMARCASLVSPKNNGECAAWQEHLAIWRHPFER